MHSLVTGEVGRKLRMESCTPRSSGEGEMKVLTYLVNILNNLQNILVDNHCLLKNYYQIDHKIKLYYQIKY